MTSMQDNESSADAERLRRLLHRKEWLLAGFQQALGHELPNDFVALQGLARLLLADHGARLDAEGRDLLERLAGQAQRADRLVRSLAEIGRLERSTDQPEPIPLSEIAAEVVTEVKAVFRNHPVEYHIQESMPTVVVARRGLYVILHHLLRNAAHAVQAKPAARVEVGALRTPLGLELWIADNGRGLSAAQQLHLFEAFQGDAASGGQGLGLFLVRQVVAGWNGSVRVQSEQGKGATFTVCFP